VHKHFLFIYLKQYKKLPIHKNSYIIHLFRRNGIMQGFIKFKLVWIHGVFIVLLLATRVEASDFSLPFVNASDLGTVYSGWAAQAEDASTAFTNPAGLTRIEHRQLVFPVLGLFGHTRFTGSTRTPPFPFPVTNFESGSSSSRLAALFPSFYFAVPLTDRITFALGQTNPYGLGTEYAKDSILRHIATKSKVVVIDFGPSLGFKVTRQLSIGAGFDAQYIMFTLNDKLGPPFSLPSDSENKNNGTGWGCGWHAGLLYEFLPCLRFGFNYLSRVTFHSSGESILYVPWMPAEYRSRLHVTASLPERAQAGFYLDVTPRFALMSTLYYTHWKIFNKLNLRDVIFFGGTTMETVIPFGYHDTLDLSVGASYKATERWLLRTGFQIMAMPSVNDFRGVADPIGSAIVVGVGARYRQNCYLSYDIGYAHSFFMPGDIQLVNPLISVFGTTKTESNLLGVQINLDF
jgi:long-chain fatty acid transport protein